MPTPIQFVYFDLGNVLLTFDHQRSCRQMAEASGTDVDAVWRFVFQGSLQWDYERGKITTGEFFDHFQRRLGCRCSQQQLLLAASDIFELQRPVWSIVERLRERRQRLGILSNTCEAHWQFVAGGAFPELVRSFPVHALSFQMQAMKPEPRAYQQAAALAGVAAETVFFTDDRDENVRAARQAGFDAVLFEDAEQLATQLHERGLL